MFSRLFAKTRAVFFAGLLALFGTFALSLPAHADITTDAQTAITAAQADALTVGGFVVAAVAALIVVGLVISMLRKL